LTRVVVTGASSGIGRATALLAAQRGFEVVAVARRADRLASMASESTTTRILTHALDLNGDQSSLIALVTGLTPAPLALVNAAGVAEFGDFASVDARRMVETNLIAPIRLIQALLPLMLESGSGQIVNVLSVAATTIFPGAAAYSASKAGLLAAGRSLAAEVRRKGIRVTSILPGAVDTPIWDGASFVPAREDMLSAEAVAQAIVDILSLPPDRNVDELTLMPPKGIL
jgi:short-subunit dehydrogenase